MILNKTILILEDDLITLSKILERLSTIEQDQPYDFSVITLTNYLQVEQFINKNPGLRRSACGRSGGFNQALADARRQYRSSDVNQ